MSKGATSPVENRSFQATRNPKIAKSTRRKPSSGGLLLGCKSHKSVRVSGDSYTSVNRTPSYVPRFHVEANPTSKVRSSSFSRTQPPFMYIYNYNHKNNSIIAYYICNSPTKFDYS